MPGSKHSDRGNPMSPASLHGQNSPSQTTAPLQDDTIAAANVHAIPSSFRNVSACYRCRARKHRCDQRLPRCGPCEKSQIRCVGYDPITREEIPRSYVYFLENRVRYLNALLVRHNIDFEPATAFDEDEASEKDVITGPDMPKQQSPGINNPCGDQHEPRGTTSGVHADRGIASTTTEVKELVDSPQSTANPDDPVLDLLVGKAAKRAVMEPDSCEKSAGTSIRTSFFGLRGETLPKECAALPSRDEADILAGLYFAHTNFHLPVLHYDEFQEILDRSYRAPPGERSAYHLYTLFIVFATGAAAGSEVWQKGRGCEKIRYWNRMGSQKSRKLSTQSPTPEEYHASAMEYLARSLVCLSSSDYLDNLRELQAMILLSGFALLRPTSPGLGRLVDVAMSSAIDLKLYSEQDSHEDEVKPGFDATGAHPEWMADWRRRLWWCVYSLERLVAPYLGRPFSIPDDVITTDFPSTLEDKFITRHGVLRPAVMKATYKHTARHYFKLRILQSEIYSVIQYQKARLGRKRDGRHQPPSIFLESYPSFSLWRKDISHRLDEWKTSIPARGAPGVWSCVLPMELDYWKAVIMLYRWSVKIPSEFIGERGAFDGILHGFAITVPAETDLICIKAAEACQKVLHIYRGLQNMGMISAIRIAIQDVFTAGSILLFTMWNSSLVRRNLALPNIDYAILAAITVMDTISEKDTSTRTFRDALQRMTTTTMQMSISKANIENPVSTLTHLEMPCTPRFGLKRPRPEGPANTPRNKMSKITHMCSDTPQSYTVGEEMSTGYQDRKHSFLDPDRTWEPDTPGHQCKQSPSSRAFTFENFIEEPLMQSPSNPSRNIDALSLASIPSIAPFAEMYHSRDSPSQEYLAPEGPEIAGLSFDVSSETRDYAHNPLSFDSRSPTINVYNEDEGGRLEGGEDVLDAFLVGWTDPCSPIGC